jgi:UDP-glucose 4-epimerase
MKKILVCGGAGFIGTHLCARLAREGHEVVVLDNFSSGNRSHEDFLTTLGVRIIEGPIEDRETLDRSAQGVDTIFQLAANPDIVKAITQPDIDFWQGTVLAQNVFEAARRNSVASVYYMSGSGVYGENPKIELREDHGPMLPISTYGASKLGCEALLCSYCHMFGMVGRAFRFANVVGPRQTHGVGFDFVRRLRRDPSKLRILGDGTQSKSYIHVDDILEAISTTARCCTTKFDVFNVATGDYLTVTQIADIAVEVCGIPREKVTYEYTGGDRGWKGDVPIVKFNCDKIHGLGWRCRRSSADAIRDSMAVMNRDLL